MEPIENSRKEIDVSTTKSTFREYYFAASNLNMPYVCNDSETIISASEPIEVKKKPIDYEQYKPYFLHVPIEKIRMTFSNSTQDAVNVMSGTRIEKTIKSPFPAHMEKERTRCDRHHLRKSSSHRNWRTNHGPILRRKEVYGNRHLRNGYRKGVR